MDIFRNLFEELAPEDNIEKMRFLADEVGLDRDICDQALDMADRYNRTEFTAFLMDYRHRHFSMADDDFDL